jgi:hypothetical protein
MPWLWGTGLHRAFVYSPASSILLVIIYVLVSYYDKICEKVTKIWYNQVIASRYKENGTNCTCINGFANTNPIYKVRLYGILVLWVVL